MDKAMPAFEVVTVNGTPRIALREGFDWNEVINLIRSQVVDAVPEQRRRAI